MLGNSIAMHAAERVAGQVLCKGLVKLSNVTKKEGRNIQYYRESTWMVLKGVSLKSTDVYKTGASCEGTGAAAMAPAGPAGTTISAGAATGISGAAAGTITSAGAATGTSDGVGAATRTSGAIAGGSSAKKPPVCA